MRSLIFLSALCLFVAAASAEPGLMGHWRFDEAKGNTVSDASGLGNDGRVKNPEHVKRVAGKVGKGLAFSGTQKRKVGGVAVPKIKSYDPTRGFAVEAWINLGEGYKRNSVNYIVNQGVQKGPGFYFAVNYGSLVLRSGDGKETWGVKTDRRKIKFEPGRWYHVAGTWDGKSFRLFVNGRETATNAESRGITTDRRGLFIGSYRGGYAFPFNGAIDEVKLYNAAKMYKPLPGAERVAARAASKPTDLYALITAPSAWTYNEKYARITAQDKYVRGEGKGILFAYTRKSSDLFDKKRKMNMAAYRPSAALDLPDGFDLADYNRLSFWVYVDSNPEEAFQWGFNYDCRYRMACHAGEWYHAKWDLMPEDGFDAKAVSRVFIRGVNQGSSPDDAQEARIYLSGFKLEKVQPDYTKGWTPAPDCIALAYTGVRPGEEVRAFVAPDHAGKTFHVRAKGISINGRVSGRLKGEGADYAEIRFTAPKQTGECRLVIDRGPSAVVSVSVHPYEEAAAKALQSIRAQRCGCASKLHGPCHLEPTIREDTGKPIDIAGGWHDEGVAQFMHLTIKTTLDLARFRRSHQRPYKLGLNEKTDDDLQAEVKWGLRSILKYDVGDNLYLHSLMRPHWYYTDNQPDTGDERRLSVRHLHPLNLWWLMEAYAVSASVCDGPLADKGRAAAEKCYRISNQVDALYPKQDLDRWHRDSRKLRPSAARLSALIEMYRLTGDAEYADEAAKQADYVLQFQDAENRKEELRGWFYVTLGRKIPYTGVGCKDMGVPGRALAEVLRTLPNHPNAAKWRSALKRFVEGTIKPLARLNAPYGNLGYGPFNAPQTSYFTGVKMGGQIVYHIPFGSRTRRKKEMVRAQIGKSQTNRAAMMAAAAVVLEDKELLSMAHDAVRFVLGANPRRHSFMRYFGDRFPVQAQVVNTPGMMVGWIGITDKGEPYFSPYGASRIEQAPHFVVKEGNTALSAYLLEACAYLEGKP